MPPIWTKSYTLTIIIIVLRGDGTGLALERFQRERFLGLFRVEHLDRDLAIEAGVVGQVDGAGPTLTERALDVVGPENQTTEPTREDLLCLECG
jgi:hypothetical protein